MVWTKEVDRPMRYLISVGRDKLRAKTLIDLWDICDHEGSTMADEVWDALFTHVERYGKTHDGGDGRGLMDREPQPDLSQPEEDESVLVDEEYADFNDPERQGNTPDLSQSEEKVHKNVFDDIVKDESVLAAAEEVEEVLDEERTKEPRMATSDMFGHQRGKR